MPPRQPRQPRQPKKPTAYVAPGVKAPGSEPAAVPAPTSNVPTAPIVQPTLQLKPKPREDLNPYGSGSGQFARPAVQPELYVVHGDPEHVDNWLNDFVSNQPQEQVSKFDYNIGSHDETGHKALVLRPNTKDANLTGIPGANPYLRSRVNPDLYLPLDAEMNMAIRPSVLRQTFIPHTEGGSIAWLHPTGSFYGEHDWPHATNFLSKSIDKEGFQPLINSIEYQTAHGNKALEPWANKGQFGFEPFEERPDPNQLPIEEPTAEDLREGGKAGSGRRSPGAQGLNLGESGMENLQSEPAPETPTPTTPVRPAQPPNPYTTMPRSRAKLFEQKTSIESSLAANSKSPSHDDPRHPMWVNLGVIESKLGNYNQSAIDYSHALWGPRPSLDPNLARQWREGMGVKDPAKNIASIIASTSKNKSLSSDDLNRFSASVADLGANSPEFFKSNPNALRSVSDFLDQHGQHLGIRQQWLAELALNQVNPNPLRMAKVRDQIWDKLNRQSFSLESMPEFVSKIGGDNQESVQSLKSMIPAIEEWAARSDRESKGSHQVTGNTSSIGKMAVALGLARLGDAASARKIMEDAQRSINILPPAQTRGQSQEPFFDAMARIFNHRFQQIGSRENSESPLPEHVYNANNIDPGMRGGFDNLRKVSGFLEPLSQVPIHAMNIRNGNETDDLVDAVKTNNPEKARSAIDRVLGAGDRVFENRHWNENARAATLMAALANRAPDMQSRIADFVVKSINRYDPSSSLDVSPLHNIVNVAAKSFASNGSGADVDRVIHAFNSKVDALTPIRAVEAVQAALPGIVSGLRRTGRQNEIGGILKSYEHKIFGGRPIKEAISQIMSGISTENEYETALSNFPSFLSALAEGWSVAGDQKQANDLIGEATAIRSRSGKTNAPFGIASNKHLKSIIDAIGQNGNKKEVAERIGELLKSYPTAPSSHSAPISPQHYGVMDSIVRAFAGDSAGLSKEARAWVDDDEYNVRRKIQSDVAEVTRGI